VVRPLFRLFPLSGAVLTLVTAAWAGSPMALPPEIPADERSKLERVTDAATVSTRFVGAPFPARREVFEYLLDHPEFAAHVTRALRIGRYRIWRTPEGLFLDDGWGARGHFVVVHAGSGLRVMRAWGEYDQPLVPSINGEAVAVIEYAEAASVDGKTQLVTVISGFVRIDNRMLAAAVKLAAPVARAKAELEARRLTKVFARVSRAIEENPVGVYDVLRQQPDVPQPELEGFRQVLNLPGTSMP
jgi:hypothetical protein